MREDTSRETPAYDFAWSTTACCFPGVRMGSNSTKTKGSRCREDHPSRRHFEGVIPGLGAGSSAWIRHRETRTDDVSAALKKGTSSSRGAKLKGSWSWCGTEAMDSKSG